MRAHATRLAALTCFLLLTGCGNDSPKQSDAGDAALTGDAEKADVRRDTALVSAEGVKIGGFETEPVSVAAWQDTYTVPARTMLDPASTEYLGSIVEGRVVKVYASPGDRVTKGQVLVSIHSHEIMDARASLGRAKAALSHAESEMRVVTSAAERAERLYGIKALSLADLERARGSRIDAQAQLDAARFELERADGFLDHLVGEGPMPKDYDEHWVLIRSLITGTVVSREAQPGSVVLVGANLLTVSNSSNLILSMQVPDGQATRVAVGGTVKFTVASYGDSPFRARVLRIMPSLDSVSRTIGVQAAVVAENGRPLRPEMFAEAQLESAPGSRATVVPAAALQTIDELPVVIAATKSGDGLLLEAMPVRTGRRAHNRIEILAGVDSGRVIVVGGAAIAKAELLKRRGGG